MIDTKNKHVFFIADNDRFFYLYADALIHKAKISPDSLVVIVFPMLGHMDNLKQLAQVTYVEMNSEAISSALDAKSITFMSLHKGNSSYVKQVLELNESISEKVHIFLTDDEVDRWGQVFKKHHNIVEDNKALIGRDDIWVLGKINKFIAHKKTFEQKLVTMLKRETIEFIDAGVIFDTLPTLESECLRQAYIKNQIFAGTEKKILIGTKQKSFNLNVIKSIIKECTAVLGDEYKFLILWHKKQRKERIFLDLYLIYLRHIKRKTVDVSYVTALNPLGYTALIMSCSHIILQGRGGASTARQFIKWSGGIICTQNGTANDFGFRDALGLDILSFKSSKELASKIKDSKISLQLNAERTQDEEKRSIQELSRLYG